MIPVTSLNLLLSTSTQHSVTFRHRPVLSQFFFFCFYFSYRYFPLVTLTFTTPLNTDTKSVGPDDTHPGLIINGSSITLVPAIQHAFSQKVTQQHFPTQWQHSVTAHVHTKDNNASVQNYRHLYLLNDFPKVSVSVMRDHLSVSVTRGHLSVSVTRDHLSVSVTRDHLSVSVMRDHLSVSVMRGHLSVSVMRDHLSVCVMRGHLSVSVMHDHLSVSVLRDHLSVSVMHDHLSVSVLRDHLSVSVMRDHLSHYFKCKPNPR